MSFSEFPDEAFAARYREFVGTVLDRFEFFGVDPRVPRRCRFDEGYVPLTMRAVDSVAGSTTVAVGDRADMAIRRFDRVLVRAVAGGGKSTLLRWLAVDTRRVVDAGVPTPPSPFLLELGRVRVDRLPTLVELVNPALREEMPDGWVGRELAAGRAVLLLDGLDEVRARERGAVEDWISELLALYPRLRCVVTTRPSVVTEQWWVDNGFHVRDLLSMSAHSVGEFVRGWHRVVRADYPSEGPAGVAAQKYLAERETHLLAALQERPALRALSGNPLLAGLLCALNGQRPNLPERRKEIFDAAVHLLLVDWPEERRRHRLRRLADPVGEAEERGPLETRLTVEEQYTVVQRLAYWQVRNRVFAVTREQAVAQMRDHLRGLLHETEDPETVLRHFTEQSGILREIENQHTAFVHRSFQDHLAARELVERGDLGLLLERADKPHWHDVVVMAGAHARPAERYDLLCGLLDQAVDDPVHADVLTLLAAAVFEQSAVLPPDRDRSPGEETRTALTRLIPPATLAAAEQLAQAGPIVLDLLPSPADLTSAEKIRIMRTIAYLAAGADPLRALDRVLQYMRDPDPGVVRQLGTAWGRIEDYEAFARNILAPVDFRYRLLEVQNSSRIAQIHYLRSLSRLVVKATVRDLSPLTLLPRLYRLTLEGNQWTDLRDVPGMPALRILTLEDCCASADQPIDLSPLRDSTVIRLVIRGLRTRVDLGSLDGAPLRSLSLTGVLGENPTAVLPDLPRLVHLELRRRVAELPGIGHLAALRRLVLTWAPSPAEADVLNALPELTGLLLVGVDPESPLPPLRAAVRHWHRRP